MAKSKAKADAAAYRTFDEIGGRLDQIIEQVRSKETPLEQSLDLFDEAIVLGSKAVELVDSVDFTPEEEARIKAAVEGEGDAAGDGAGEKGEPAAGDDAEDAATADDAASDDAGEKGETAPEEA